MASQLTMQLFVVVVLSLIVRHVKLTDRIEVEKRSASEVVHAHLKEKANPFRVEYFAAIILERCSAIGRRDERIACAVLFDQRAESIRLWSISHV